LPTLARTHSLRRSRAKAACVARDCWTKPMVLPLVTTATCSIANCFSCSPQGCSSFFFSSTRMRLKSMQRAETGVSVSMPPGFGSGVSRTDACSPASTLSSVPFPMSSSFFQVIFLQTDPKRVRFISRGSNCEAALSSMGFSVPGLLAQATAPSETSLRFGTSDDFRFGDARGTFGRLFFCIICSFSSATCSSTGNSLDSCKLPVAVFRDWNSVMAMAAKRRELTVPLASPSAGSSVFCFVVSSCRSSGEASDEVAASDGIEPTSAPSFTAARGFSAVGDPCFKKAYTQKSIRNIISVICYHGVIHLTGNLAKYLPSFGPRSSSKALFHQPFDHVKLTFRSWEATRQHSWVFPG
jgi:hypothetical protein